MTPSSARLDSMRRNLQPGWVLYDVGVDAAVCRSLATLCASRDVKLVHVELQVEKGGASILAGTPDAIVLDVKGAELEVLKVWACTIVLSAKPALWISCHPVRMSDLYYWGATYLWKCLREYGYSWRLLDYDDALEVVAWHPDRPVSVDR